MTVKRSASHDASLCLYPFADGRHCRMLRLASHPSLCVFHAREERQLLEAETNGEDLAESLSGHFTTAGDVNHVLGKLFAAVAKNRIPPRNAATLAYVGQLLLQSLPPIKSDVCQTYGHQAWSGFVRETFSAADTEEPQS
ncbi:MAG: hypothetical protein PVS2B2_27910 [Candidatus Acidiferrum sp.]